MAELDLEALLIRGAPQLAVRRVVPSVGVALQARVAASEREEKAARGVRVSAVARAVKPQEAAELLEPEVLTAQEV
jgi:hypothetical protein